MLVCLIFKDLLLERAVGMSEVCVELVGKLVGEMLGLSKEELSPSDNLISLGLGSLDIMRIAGLLTKNGCNVTFSELVSNPCMASWVNFARERSARSSSNGSPLSVPQITQRRPLSDHVRPTCLYGWKARRTGARGNRLSRLYGIRMRISRCGQTRTRSGTSYSKASHAARPVL